MPESATNDSKPATEEVRSSALQILATRLDASWPHIEKAGREAAAKRAKIESIIGPDELPADTGLLVFGLLARDEWTSGSDVDWTLLVDGQADPGHVRVRQSIDDCLAHAGLKKPGRTGVFGGLSFSHPIVHHIGGEADTNRNTTQRILLLLESRSVGRMSSGQPDDVRDRVIRALLDHYLEDDLSLHTPSGGRHRVPRFLLNDIVRFWRTMAVDYASKRRERGDKDWATRNLKLRFSRKLIFVAGLLACFSPTHDTADDLTMKSINGIFVAPLVAHLRNFTDQTPLQILAYAADKYCDDAIIRSMFDPYDAFLAILDDPSKREHLANLPSADAEGDSGFQEVREISRQFQGALTALFFASDDRLTEFSKEYGLF